MTLAASTELEPTPATLPRPPMRWPFGSGKQIGWSFALVVLRMVVMGVALLGVLRPALTHGESLRSGRPAELAEHAILTLLAIAFAFVFIRGVPRASWADLGLSRENLGRNVAIGLATFAIGAAYVVIHLAATGDLREGVATFTGYTLGQRLQMLLVGIHVVFGEEMIFRGYLQPGLRARFSAPVAIGITAIVFAAYHVELTPAALLGHIAWSIGWSFVREKTGSSIPSSLAHFLNWTVIGWI